MDSEPYCHSFMDEYRYSRRPVGVNRKGITGKPIRLYDHLESVPRPVKTYTLDEVRRYLSVHAQ